MWSDNASDVDLLGYEDLIEEIVELSTDASLQPLTIGAFADWGAGKSTLLRLAGAGLESRGALVVEFSPWLVEGYDDVKSCLLGAVVEKIASVDVDDETKSEKVRRLVGRLRGRVDWLRVAKLGASAVVPIAGVALDTLQGFLKDAPAEDSQATMASSAEVSKGFNLDFQALVDELDYPGPLVVLIDDLDRCLPDQVIETLEAIRLFLSAPGTAFVIAADERLVRDAVRRRYAAASEIEIDLPREYLEKLVHVALRIPTLSRPDAESYCNLLVAQRLLDEEQFTAILETAHNIRTAGELTVSCNIGIVRDALDDDSLPGTLEEEFGLIGQVIGPLASGLNGNPRQVKRFLNTLSIRRRTAKRRRIDVDEAVLAKLTVLEYVSDSRFRELHSWQQRGAGVCEELATLEAAIDELETIAANPAVGTWASDSWVRDWLRVEPRLAGVDLTAYFFLSRDRVGTSRTTSLLPPGLQVLATNLGDESSAVRDEAIDAANSLDHEPRLMLIEACSAKLPGLLDRQPMMKSMIELAEKHAVLVNTVVSGFAALAYPTIPPDIPIVLAGRLTAESTREAIVGLLHSWETQEASAQLSKTALLARTGYEKSNGHV